MLSRYKIESKIGSGSFGEVYDGTDLTNGKKIAIKLESNEVKCPQLYNESKIYNNLQKLPCIPRFYWYGIDNKHNIMVTELLGPSMEVLSKKPFNSVSIMVIAEKIIDIIENFHNSGYIHRDIKPDNFLTKDKTIYIIDFGLSKKYLSLNKNKLNEHISYSSGKTSLIGTPRYASINNHRGIEQSRRDDIEAIGYMLVYFAKGVLPWQGLKAETKTIKYSKIMHTKISTPITEICACEVSDELCKYIEYARNLKFTDTPNYSYLKGLFHNSLITKKYGPIEDSIF